MATSAVNLVDAIADVIPRIAQARTATLRVGKVISVVTGVATVQVGAAVSGSTPITIKARYHTNYTPVVNDVVSLLTDRDVWLVLGKLVK